ncbi:hypothetical protein GYMLUDRAFT_51198 [Collybiopsis luxurians FD-317 M1]|uniref:Uncharacterized protein n=1 Tax=Collybiopsis luxurians FD-317 M1 TaxID=944289 RepID=A0A0D0BYH0_9AGAR|nr:hypothetical protein GYMLUDRAFT_51198 [Collybiopsis luxurians FD-317 M1]
MTKKTARIAWPNAEQSFDPLAYLASLIQETPLSNSSPERPTNMPIIPRLSKWGSRQTLSCACSSIFCAMIVLQWCRSFGCGENIVRVEHASIVPCFNNGCRRVGA